MRYFALASDYDGTLAHHGAVEDSTIDALKRVRDSGRKLLLVTGRELPELQMIFPQLDLFDSVVVENGALLYTPSTKKEQVLADPPPERLISALRGRGIDRLSVGRVIVATWEDYKSTVLEVVNELGLELQLIFNKGALMILPSGVNKASGLAAALEAMCLSRHNVAGIGDAENDHAFLSLCECGVAVANALPALKERADVVMNGVAGEGVRELIDSLLKDDLRSYAPRLSRYDILLGTDEAGQKVCVHPYGTSLMVAGTSGGGKTTLTTGFLERLTEAKYQFCVIDPEGDYQNFTGAVVLGDTKNSPTVNEILSVLETPSEHVIVNLVGIDLDKRPEFFDTLLPRLHEMRSRTGRPHWIIIDEAHHLLPASWQPSTITIPKEMTSMMLITLEPDHVAPSMLACVNTLVAVGKNPEETIRKFSGAANLATPDMQPVELKRGEVLLWCAKDERPPVRVKIQPGTALSSRHARKYAAGELPPDRSFYFRGPEGKLNLRAQNLVMFLQLMDGVDEETWLYHLRRRDYSRWFLEEIKSDDLSAATADIEGRKRLSAAESRALIREEIQRRFTLPA